MLLVASKLVSSMLLKSVKILTIFSILADSSVKFDVISDTDFEIFSAEFIKPWDVQVNVLDLSLTSIAALFTSPNIFTTASCIASVSIAIPANSSSLLKCFSLIL